LRLLPVHIHEALREIPEEAHHSAVIVWAGRNREPGRLEGLLGFRSVLTLELIAKFFDSHLEFLSERAAHP